MTPATTNPRPARPIDASKIIVFWPLGSTRPSDENQVGQGFGVDAPGGFDAWVSNHVLPLYARGCRRLLAHNPLGNEPGTAMDLDQAMDLAERGGAWNLQEFDAAMDRIGSECPTMQVICYIGTREQDLSAAMVDHRFREHLVRMTSFFTMTRTLDMPHVTYAFDAASDFEEGYPEAHLVRMIRAYKARHAHEVYIEARPRHAWQHDLPFVCMERFHHPRRIEIDAAGYGGSEIVRVYTALPDMAPWAGDTEAWLADCVSRGDTPAIGWSFATSHTFSEMTFEEVAAAANARAQFPADPGDDPGPDPDTPTVESRLSALEERVSALEAGV